MASPTETAPVVTDNEFDPLEFWIRHKGRIVLYGSLLIAALAIYGLYEAIHRHSVQAAEAAYASAASAEDFRKVIAAHPGSIIAGNARLMLADKLRAEGKLDEAVATLREFIAKNGEHALLSGAHTSLAATLEMQGKLDEALVGYQKVTASFPASFSAPAALVAQGRIFKAQGKAEEARRAFENVQAQFGESLFASEAARELQGLKK